MGDAFVAKAVAGAETNVSVEAFTIGDFRYSPWGRRTYRVLKLTSDCVGIWNANRKLQLGNCGSTPKK